MGVGLFVCNSGMVSRQLRYKGGWRYVLGVVMDGVALSRPPSLLFLLCLSWVLVDSSMFIVWEWILCDCVVFGYQHVVSEYGYHWNFFFTLALVAIFSAICAGFMANRFIVFLSLCACLGCYQYWLLHGGTEYDIGWEEEGIGTCWMMFVQHSLIRIKKESWAVLVWINDKNVIEK